LYFKKLEGMPASAALVRSCGGAIKDRRFFSRDTIVLDPHFLFH
jgi:hypothetical protein